MAKEAPELVGKDIYYFKHFFQKLPMIAKALDITDEVPLVLPDRKAYLLYYTKGNDPYVIIVDIQENMLIGHWEFIISQTPTSLRQFPFQSYFFSRIAEVHMGFKNPEDFIQLILRYAPK